MISIVIPAYNEAACITATLDNLAAPGQLDEIAEMRDAGPRLAAAREFVTSGGVGYALFTGRNPREMRS